MVLTLFYHAIRRSDPPSTSCSDPAAVANLLPSTAPSVVAADSLAKRDVFRLPDPFAVITVDGEQTHTTSVIKKTLNPYWNENFDMWVGRCGAEPTLGNR